MSKLNSSLPAWGAVAAHAKELVKAKLRDLSASDPKRWQNFHVEHDGWLLDISRQRITRETLALLFDLARAVDVPGRIAAMFRGDPINATEQRAVLHTALRSDFAGGPAIQAEVKASRQKLVAYVAAVRSGKKVGATGKKFKHVVNVGIGGSDLGPLLVCDALRHEWSGGLTPHFVSNVDRTQLEDLTRTIDPAETLVIICSKTFVTQETQSNANAAREWIVGALGEKSPANHFVAVSTNGPAMDKFGIAPDHRFTMWDWVGGRYSVWSAIGLIAEIVIGSERFEEFLRGASDIDRHFTTTPFEKNLPVLLGLIGVWNRTFLNLPTSPCFPTISVWRDCLHTCSSSKWRVTASLSRWTGSTLISPRRPSCGENPDRTRSIHFFKCCTKAP
jgi:glucose-6-phosphate isomerase